MLRLISFPLTVLTLGAVLVCSPAARGAASNPSVSALRSYLHPAWQPYDRRAPRGSGRRDILQ